MSSAEIAPVDEEESKRGKKLVLAAGRGSYTVVRRLLEKEVDINTRCPPPFGILNHGKGQLVESVETTGIIEVAYGTGWVASGELDLGRTALQAAADGGHEELVKLLIQYRADVNEKPAENFGRTALQAAADGGHGKVVKLLIEAGANVNAPPVPYYGMTALQAAAWGGHKEVVEFLIKKEADVNALPADKYGRTALQAAAQGGHEDIVRLLIKAKANINESPAKEHGVTALQAAAWGGYEKVVKLLVEYEEAANINAPPAEVYGRTALQAAAEGGHEELVKFFIGAGAHVNAPRAETSGKTALEAAGSHRRIRELLIAAKALEYLGSPRFTRENNLVLAAQRGDYNLVKWLLETGVNVDARHPPELMFNSGKAKVDSQDWEKRDDGFYHILKFHVQCDGGSVEDEKPMDFARTALQAAVDSGHERVVKLLIDFGADINAPPAEHSGRTALQAAVEGGHEELMQLLIRARADVNAPPAKINGRTALQAAAENGNEKLRLLLIQYGALEGEKGPKPTMDDMLVLEAGRGDCAAVNRLLKDGADINARCLPPLEGSYNEKAGIVNCNGYRYQLVMPSDGCRGKRPMYFARTALQAAAEGGHKEAVKLLISSGADINALPAKRFGRTALQAAAEGGHEKVVELLMEAGANVNAPQAREYGRTVLQAAIEDGNESLVQYFIGKGADVNAPPAEFYGKTALQAAAEGWHEEVLDLLIKSKVDLHRRNNLGQNILHEACKAGDVGKLDLLLRLDNFDINTKDYSGSTPLHIATKEGKEAALKLLLPQKGINMNIKDNFGETPLQIALEKGYGDILDLLLERGANPGCLKVHKLPNLRRTRYSSSDEDMITLLESQLNRTTHILQHTKWTLKNGKKQVKISDLRDWWRRKNSSICLLRPTKNSIDTELFADPNAYIPKDFSRGSAGGIAKVSWAWLIIDERGGGTADFIRVVKGVPNSEDIISMRPAKTVLVGYACFNVLVHLGTTQNSPSGTAAKLPQPETRKIEISWTMKEQEQEPEKFKGPFLRSIHYRGTLNLRYLSIPSHSIDFFILLLDDVHESWLELLKEAKLCLANMRSRQLKKNGKDPKIIQGLLLYTQQWNSFREDLQQHKSTSIGLLSDFRKYDILHTELTDSHGNKEDAGEVKKDAGEAKEDVGEVEVVKGCQGDLGEAEVVGGDQGDNIVAKATQEIGNNIGRPKAVKKGRDNEGTKETRKYEGGAEELEAIKRLSKKIGDFENECKEEISNLEKETMDMIDLEFNLVSIYEARRSVSMSVSMKRLSWITFIFLPLMFTTGLFGMNVDVLKGDPSWLWYIAFVVPIMILLILVWILFKYIPISKWIEENIGSRLKLNPNNKNKKKPTSSCLTLTAPKKLDSPDPATIESGFSNRTYLRQESFAWLRRKQKGNYLDEEKAM